MQEADLKALVAPPTKLCINSTCMQEGDLKRVNTLFPSGYINVVNKRPLFGIGMETNTNVITGATPTLLIPGLVYNPFGYNVPEPAPGTTRQYRLYCVYSDSITGGAGPVVRLSVLDSKWVEANNFVDFKLPLTWGGLGAETRDAYSQLVSTPPNPMHCKLYSFVPATATGTPSVLWQYIELQTLDIYP